MSQDIIAMAREAGAWAQQSKNCDVEYVMSGQSLERFATLVADAERDRIADEAGYIIKRAEARGAAAEREQIAQMIEDAPPLVEFAKNEHGGCLMCGFTPKVAAAFIRERGNT